MDYVIEISHATNFVVVLRVGEAALELAVKRLQGRLERAEAMNCELEGDLLDRGEKFAYYRNQRIPELIEENRYLWAWIDSLASIDIQIKNLEVQLAEGWERVERVAEVKRRLAEALDEALPVRLDQLKSEKAAAEAKVESMATLGNTREQCI